MRTAVRYLVAAVAVLLVLGQPARADERVEQANALQRDSSLGCPTSLDDIVFTTSPSDPTWASTDGGGRCDAVWIVLHRGTDLWEVAGSGDDASRSCGAVPAPLEIARELDVCANEQQCEAQRASAADRRSILRGVRSRARAGARPTKIVGHVKLGACGRTHWALASFSFPRVGTTDQPSVVRRTTNGWKLEADTGGMKCAAAYSGPVPFEMIDSWFIDPFPCENSLAGNPL